MAKYKEILDNAKKLAEEHQKEESAVLILLLHFSKMESAILYANINEECPNDVFESFNDALNKYIYDNIPVQHITGYETFYGYNFIVNGDVLIPRVETEELVENILYEYDDLFDGKVDVVDIGCGSGCIGITLALEEPNMNVTLTDISFEALEVAKKNALNLGANVRFLQGDMLEPVKKEKFDILVSNPPYIPDNEDVCSLVKDNEPWVALFGGEDGLKFYRIILSQAHEILKEKSIIAFEHAYDKGEAMVNLAKKYFPNANVKLIKDIFGKDRMTIIINGGK